MAKLFGTDGIRGLANQPPITAEMGERLGRAVIASCRRQGLAPRVAIGRDTRGSGEALEKGIVKGIVASGGTACILGVLPTPGVAYLTKHLRAGAGIVISASHNPADYNGFKVFSSQGFKLSEAEETEMEDLMLSEQIAGTHDSQGGVDIIHDARRYYAEFALASLPGKVSFDEMKVVLDCANGAMSEVAPTLFEGIGARTETLFAAPDGKNINLNCGSEHTQPLREKVLNTKSDAGFAFDGDGDRLIAVDEKGEVLTGDQLMTIYAKMMKEMGTLRNHLVVSTVMSNIGFRLALESLGIKHVSTRVGDRFVVEEMRVRNASLGGENSGHMVFLDHHTTGDGLISALQLLYAIKTSGKPLSALSSLMTPFPQTLINVPVKIKPDLSRVPEIMRVIREVELRLGHRGRVLVRYSGTEPVCRVMVEGEERQEIERYARQIAGAIRRNLYSNSSDSSEG